jgi:hypothetical protein
VCCLRGLDWQLRVTVQVQAWKARIGEIVGMGGSSGELKLGAVLVLVTKVFQAKAVGIGESGTLEGIWVLLWGSCQ